MAKEEVIGLLSRHSSPLSEQGSSVLSAAPSPEKIATAKSTKPKSTAKPSSKGTAKNPKTNATSSTSSKATGTTKTTKNGTSKAKPKKDTDVIEIKDDDNPAQSSRKGASGSSGIVKEKAKDFHKRGEEMEVYDEAEKIENDWQIAYVWAFLQRFEIDILGLYSLEQFEEALQQSTPHQGLINLFWYFWQELRPDVPLKGKTGRPGADGKGKGKVVMGRPTDNVADYERQNTISIKIQQLIADRLSSSSATIWDPYTYQVHAAGKSNLHGVSRASLPNIDDQDETSQLDEKKKEERAILEGLEARYWMDEDGKKRVRSVDERNPLRVKSKEEGEGIVQEIWELKWQQKSKILRQMADWMLVENKDIKSKIDELYPKGKARQAVTAISVLPLERDSENNRIWSIDKSYRIYSSGNPNKMDSPMTTISTSGEEYDSIMNRYLTRTQDLAKYTKRYEQASKAKEKNLKVLLDRLVLEISIGTQMHKKLPIIEEEMEALPQRITNYIENQAKKEKNRIRRVNLAAEQAQWAEMRRIGGARPRTRGLARNEETRINYAEDQGNADDDFEDDGEDDVIALRGKGKRSDRDEDEDDYVETDEEERERLRKRPRTRQSVASNDGTGSYTRKSASSGVSDEEQDVEDKAESVELESDDGPTLVKRRAPVEESDEEETEQVDNDEGSDVAMDVEAD